MFIDEKKIGEATVTLEPWRQRLLAAAQYIRHYGWCQEQTIAENGAVCLVGAVHFCGDEKEYPNTELEKLGIALGTPWIADWNDDPSRTKEEVIAVLEKVAMS